MLEYSLAHIGINANSSEDAVKIAECFCFLFGWEIKTGTGSIFADSHIEVMREPYLGRNGHIAVAVADVAAARLELESKGVAFDLDTAKWKDGQLNTIYLKEEIGGFAVHLVKKL